MTNSYGLNKNIRTLLVDITKMFEKRKSESWTFERYKKEREIMLIRANTLSTARERFAGKQLIDALERNMLTYDLTTGYIVDGEVYCVHNNNKPVPNCKSTEILHNLNLKSDEWDSFKRVFIWSHSGIIERSL